MTRVGSSVHPEEEIHREDVLALLASAGTTHEEIELWLEEGATLDETQLLALCETVAGKDG